MKNNNKIILDEYTDDSQYYRIKIKVLLKDDSHPTKISFEIHHLTQKDIRSFRTSDKFVAEKFAEAIVKGIAILLCDNGYFNAIATNELLKGNELELAVNTYLNHFLSKLRSSFWEGVRVFHEKKRKWRWK